jgi:hypothetical protein
VKNQKLEDHLMKNMWRPLVVHTIFQLSWLSIQIKYEFSAWIFFTVMITAFVLLLSWPGFEKKRFNVKT